MATIIFHFALCLVWKFSLLLEMEQIQVQDLSYGELIHLFLIMVAGLLFNLLSLDFFLLT